MKFTSETGIKASDWLGIYWARWSDALREAGFSANKFGTAYDKDELLTKYADLVQELDRLPIDAELRLTTRTDKTSRVTQHLAVSVQRYNWLPNFSCSVKNATDTTML